MRLAHVTGKVTLNRRLEELRPGSYLICEVVDTEGLAALPDRRPRAHPMPESLIVFDQLGAGEGDLIAFSEGREAANPFHPARVPLDATTAAIIDMASIAAVSPKTRKVS